MPGKSPMEKKPGRRKKETGRLKISRGRKPPGVLKAGSVTTDPLTVIYQRLRDAFGPQKWWPAQTKFEVVVGAILTQNTNWGNVEKALDNLKKERLLSPQALQDIPSSQLAALIKPAGYFNVKTKRLKHFISFLFQEYGGELRNMAREETMALRRKLLGVNGVGPETADSILLYAFNKPVFVVDAYTKRFLYRHNLIARQADYDTAQRLFTDCFWPEVQLFNEYHALIVKLGKEYCRPSPRCEQCVLKDFHYSVTVKCGSCHRALLEDETRHAGPSGSICGACFPSEKVS
jgi:endonuclease-3 related protein